MAHTTGIESHPDLIELRARYERAGLSPMAGIANGLLLLAGIYLAFSPWAVGFNQAGQLTVTNLIVGGGLFFVAASYALAFDRTHTVAWIAPLIGIWTIIAPWVVYPTAGAVSATPAEWINNVIVGGVITLAGAAVASLGAMRAIRARRR